MYIEKPVASVCYYCRIEKRYASYCHRNYKRVILYYVYIGRNYACGP